METNASRILMSNSSSNTWYWIPHASKTALFQIRDLNALEIAPSDRGYWVRKRSENLDSTSPEKLCTLPGVLVYSLRDAQLYLQDKILPSLRAPHLLWSPSDHLLPIELPRTNKVENFTPPPLSIKLIKDDSERSAFSQLVDTRLLAAFAKTAPLVRLEPITFCFIGEEKALLKGTPLLPLPGKGFWRKQQDLLPLGYAFEYPEALELFPTNEMRVWQTNGTCYSIPSRYWTPLRRDNCEQEINTTL